MKRSKKTTLSIEEIAENQKIKQFTHELNKIVLSDRQSELIDMLENNVITLITGPAGTAKTFMVCYYAIQQYMLGEIDQIILTKPLQEAGEKTGFLPGSLMEKIGPMFESFKSNFEKIIGKVKYNDLVKKEIIKYEPLAFMRGKTYSNCLDGKTKIQTSEGLISLEDIFSNSITNTDYIYYVLSYDIDNDLIEFQEITGISRNKRNNKVLKFTFEDDSELILTKEHVLYDDKLNLIKAKDFKINDLVYSK